MLNFIKQCRPKLLVLVEIYNLELLWLFMVSIGTYHKI